jgi:hypothetical protein
VYKCSRSTGCRTRPSGNEARDLLACSPRGRVYASGCIYLSAVAVVLCVAPFAPEHVESKAAGAGAEAGFVGNNLARDYAGTSQHQGRNNQEGGCPHS